MKQYFEHHWVYEKRRIWGNSNFSNSPGTDFEEPSVPNLIHGSRWSESCAD